MQNLQDEGGKKKDWLIEWDASLLQISGMVETIERNSNFTQENWHIQLSEFRVIFTQVNAS